VNVQQTRTDSGYDKAQPSIVTRALPWVLAMGGGIGVLAAFLLTIERLRLAADPSYVPSCSINPILSCGSVMKTEQAAVFGFPNPLIGIAAFALITTVGMALLADAQFRDWFWYGLQLGTTFGIVFVHWLIYQSIYRIGALCPYCMVVWGVMIPIFWYVTLANVESSRIRLGRAGSVATRYHTVVLTIWMLTIVGLILQRFWSYWVTVL
jgi:uncharacterized membrane protein